MDEKDSGHLTSTMERSGTLLRLWNAGATLSRRQMALFGESGKDDHARGKFGEGFQIVEFSSREVLGIRVKDTISISRRILGERETTLRVLVEEIAHAKGSDGSMAHKWELHAIYCRLVMALWQDIETLQGVQNGG